MTTRDVLLSYATIEMLLSRGEFDSIISQVSQDSLGISRKDGETVTQAIERATANNTRWTTVSTLAGYSPPTDRGGDQTINSAINNIEKPLREIIALLKELVELSHKHASPYDASFQAKLDREHQHAEFVRIMGLKS